MGWTRFFTLALVLTLLLALGGAAGAQEPQLLAAGGCAPGINYDSNCDVDHNGTTDILDLQLVANHWGQQGVFASDNTHDHLGQIWAGSQNPLTINGTFSSAPLLISNSDLTGDGVRVGPVGGDGVVVSSADFDGVHVSNAGGDGVRVDAAGFFAGSFNGNVEITGSCTNCVQSVFGRNAGQTALEPGDVVAVRGVTRMDLLNSPVVMDVELAAGSDAVVGGVAGRAELGKYSKSQGKTIQRLIPGEGPAQPGDYVNIVVHGLVQVKASATAAPLQQGARLTGSDRAGHARALRTVAVQGVQVSESGPVLGVALENLEAGQEGLIWAMVNPR